MLLNSCGNKPKLNMVNIPRINIKMLKTEVTQKLYASVMGENPSNFKGDNLPVENVSWYDAVKFCNELSMKKGLFPVYTINGEGVTWDKSANGFRLPTLEEWFFAAIGGQDYDYPGSNNLDEVAWYYNNSNEQTHPVARKKANGYGLYDMVGNVEEWCWDWDTDPVDYDFRFTGCGNWYSSADSVCYFDTEPADRGYPFIGFRIVRTVK